MPDDNKPAHEENAEKISVSSEVERTGEREAAVDAATQPSPDPPTAGEPATEVASGEMTLALLSIEPITLVAPQEAT